MSNANNTRFTFAGTTFEVVSSYGGEVFSLYQISASLGRSAMKQFTIGEGRADIFSLEHAALEAITHQEMAARHARMEWV
jgi:hypothetical protein